MLNKNKTADFIVNFINNIDMIHLIQSIIVVTITILFVIIVIKE